MPGQDGGGFGSPDECLNLQMRTAGCRTMVCGHLRKRRRAEEPSAWMLFGMLDTSKGKEEWNAKRMLPDSDAASSIIVSEPARKLKVKKESKTDWDTPAGKFATDGKVKICLQLLLEWLPAAETNYYVAHVHAGNP